MKKNVTKKAMGMVKWFLPFYLFTFLPLSMMAQDDDDMYFVPTKKTVERQQQTYGVPQYTYYPGSTRNVDEYNRRFQSDVCDTAMNDSVLQDYTLTRQMSRWDGYEPTQSYWDGYADGRRDGAWHSPWFYNSLYPWYDAYWYDPWYMDRWYLYRGMYDPWYWSYGHYGYYGYAGWYGPYYYGYGYYAPYYGGYAYSTGTTGTQNHGKINYNGPRGLSNGRSTTYSAGTFGGSRIGSSSRSTGTLGSRQGATRNSSATTSTSGRTTNAYGNFGGNRARTTNTTPATTAPTRTFTPATTSSSGGMSGGGSFGGSRSSGGGSSSGGGGGRFGGRR